MKLKRTLASQAGFTYIAMIVMVTVMLIMMGQVATSWKSFIQRSKEEELLFRGMQVREAMQRYYYGRVINVRTDLKPADTERANKKPNLKELKDLLEDPGSAEKKRYLRPFALKDPMTGEDWVLIKNANQRIIGVKSSSKATPFKVANFPYQLEPADFEQQSQPAPAEGAVQVSEQKYTYDNWQFIFDRIPLPKEEGGQGVLPGSTPGTPGSPPGNPPPPRAGHPGPGSTQED